MQGILVLLHGGRRLVPADGGRWTYTQRHPLESEGEIDD